jgi:carboxylesterase type B
VRRFIYAHTFTSPGWGEYRAAHGFELIFLFGPLPSKVGLNFDESEKKLQTEMIRAWVNFASSDSPEEGAFNWPTYDPALDNYLMLDTPPRMSNAFRKTQCDFWDQYEAKLYP